MRRIFAHHLNLENVLGILVFELIFSFARKLCLRITDISIINNILNQWAICSHLEKLITFLIWLIFTSYFYHAHTLLLFFFDYS